MTLLSEGGSKRSSFAALTPQQRHAVGQLVTAASLSDDFWSYYEQGRGRLSVPSASKTPPRGSLPHEVQLDDVNQFLIFLNALRLFSFYPLASQLEAVVLPDRCIRAGQWRRGELRLCLGVARLRLPCTTTTHRWVRCCRFRESRPPDAVKSDEPRTESPADGLLQPLLVECGKPTHPVVDKQQSTAPSMTIINGDDDDRPRKRSLLRRLFGSCCMWRRPRRSAKYRAPVEAPSPEPPVDDELGSEQEALAQAVIDHFASTCLRDAGGPLSEFVEKVIGALFLAVDGDGDTECCGLEPCGGLTPRHVALSICVTAPPQLVALERVLANKSFLAAVKAAVFPCPTPASSCLSSPLGSCASPSPHASSASTDSCRAKSPEPEPEPRQVEPADVELFAVVRSAALSRVEADLKPDTS